MKLRAWQCLVTFLSSVGLLVILVGLAFLWRMERSTEPKLFAHPNALWIGAEDGGVFVEIIGTRHLTTTLRSATRAVGCGPKVGFGTAHVTAIRSALRP